MLASLSAGGHLRVGMEDTITYAKGRPVESNMQLVARAVGFAQLAQRPPLTAAEARTLLGIPA
jgi:3-keto-5-aminohexanoate cleavage enzyme